MKSPFRLNFYSAVCS